jgi:hypothetical protein
MTDDDFNSDIHYIHMSVVLSGKRYTIRLPHQAYSCEGSMGPFPRSRAVLPTLCHAEVQ